MRRFLSVFLVISLTWALFGHILFAQRGPAVDAEPKEKDIVDLTADVVYPIDINDTIEAVCLVGNFAAQHNGTIITADSAIRYGDNKIECFGKVLINKNTTYAYADAADYDSELCEANLYAPIVKVVDGDAVLYTYNFSFNTETNIGRYSGGGVMHNHDDIMESYSGYMYADSSLIIAVDDVELSGEGYQMQSDSVIYNTETDFAEYFDNTNIWNEKDEYLYADKGEYSKAEDRYTVTQNGYILTAEQEMWSDSINYYRQSEQVYLRSNIQMDDTTQKSLVFGQYGEYHRFPGNLVLTGKPIVINYDPEQGVDSLFMRADTIYMNTYNTQQQKRDSLARLAADSVAAPLASTGAMPDSLMPPAAQRGGGQPMEHSSMMQRGQEGEQMQPQSSDRPARGERDNRGGEEPDSQRPSRPEMPVGGESLQPEQRPEQPQSPTTSSTTPPIDVPEQRPTSSEVQQKVASSLEEVKQTISSDSTDMATSQSQDHDNPFVDSLGQDSVVLDSMAIDSLDSLAGLDTLKFWQRWKLKYQAKKSVYDEKRREKNAIRAVKLDSIAEVRQAKINAELDAEKAREARRIAERKAKVEHKAAMQRARDVRRGKISVEDTLAIRRELDSIAFADSVALADSLQRDSLDKAAALMNDSLAVDSLAVDSLALIEPELPDSIYRIIRGIHNVKIFRADVQAVCDSLIYNSSDSIAHLYVDPILWNEGSQINSEVMDIYIANQQVDKAIFIDDAMIASQIDTTYYNQVAGKKMVSLFVDGEIYRHDVDGNVQTIYFMQEEDENGQQTGKVNGMMVLESGGATFYINGQTLDGITYRGAPAYTLYPMNMIPATQEYKLKGFVWEIMRQPTRESMFNQPIRPTQRKEKSELPRPTFPINADMDRQKEELKHRREWAERDELVSPQAEEWLQSLGFKSGQPREEQNKDSE